MLVLGDAHADTPRHRQALLSAYEAVDATLALQVGDLLHYAVPVETYFVAGNNEALDVIEALRQGTRPEGVENVHLLSSRAVDRDGIRIAGLSGNFAPMQFEKDREDLEGDRRRHFVNADVDAAATLSDVDVFLTHEAPHGLLHTDGYDVGCKHVDRILRELTPQLCLVGHHHEFVRSSFGETTVISLAPVWDEYYTLDPDTLAMTRHSRAEQD